jgi:hypothetical protein
LRSAKEEVKRILSSSSTKRILAMIVGIATV